MNRRVPLILITDPAQVASGLQPDKHQLFKPLWDLASGVRFYQGGVHRLIPAAATYGFGALAEAARGLSQHQDSTGIRWLWTAWINELDGITVYRWYAPAAEAVHTFLPAAVSRNQTATKLPTYIDFLHWGNWTLINPTVGAAMLFKPDDGIAALTNAPTDVLQFLKKENQLMAIGHGLTRKEVSWCDADQITVWAGASDNLAGQFAIEELDTGIRAATKLGGNVSVYAEDQMALIYRIGQPFVFGQRVVLDGIGAVGKMAVCSDGRLNYGVSRNGVWRTDGTDFQYIDEGAVAVYLQENVNWDQAGKIVAFRNDVTRCIEFFFPTGSQLEASEGWSFDPRSSGWSQLPAFQLAQERKLFETPIAMGTDTVYLLDSNPALDMPLVLRTKPMLVQSDKGSPLHIGSRIDEVELALKEAVGVQFRYGVAEDVTGPWTYSEWTTVSPDMRTYKLTDNIPTGTYHVLEFQRIISAYEFNLQGFALFGETDGTKREDI